MSADGSSAPEPYATPAPPSPSAVSEGSGADWRAAPERGSDAVNRFFAGAAKRFGRGPARAVLPAITAYFTLAAPDARKASADYLARVRPGPVGWLDTWRHVHAFGGALLDRLFLGLDPAGFDIQVHGAENITRHLGPGRPGLILLLAHVGSFEALRAGAARENLPPVRLVMDRQHGGKVMDLLEEFQPGLKDSIIDARQSSPALALAIGEAVARGEVVGLMADRLTPGDAGVEVSFLGSPCRLPAGPWLLAAALKAPVVMALGLPRAGRRYDLYFETLSERLDLPRAERRARLADHVAAYARRLEHYLADAPYSWSNFFPFFDAPPPARPRDAGASASPPP